MGIIESVVAFFAGLFDVVAGVGVDFYGLVVSLTFRQAVIVAYLLTIFTIAGGWFYVYRKEEAERERTK
jgi:uncharacterized membrane protein